MIQRSLVGRIKHIWSEDAAVDKKHPAYSFEKYLDTGDAAHMPLMDGQRATVFHIKPLTRAQYLIAKDEPSIERRAHRAIAFALVDVENFELNGEPVRMKRVGEGESECVDKDVLEKLFTPDLFLELGGRIMLLSTVLPFRGTGSPPHP